MPVSGKTNKKPTSLCTLYLSVHSGHQIYWICPLPTGENSSIRPWQQSPHPAFSPSGPAPFLFPLHLPMARGWWSVLFSTLPLLWPFHTRKAPMSFYTADHPLSCLLFENIGSKISGRAPSFPLGNSHFITQHKYYLSYYLKINIEETMLPFTPSRLSLI